MSVLVWDSTSQAFKEANTPMVHDIENQAWRETTGKAYNQTAGAWEEKWSPSQDILYLYNEGDECSAVTGGWSSDGYVLYNGEDIERTTQASYNKNSDNMYLYCNGAGCAGILGTSKAIDITKYNKVYIDAISYGLSSTDQCMAFTFSMGKASHVSNRILNKVLNESNGGYEVRTTYEFDISSLSGNIYAFFSCENNTYRKGYIYKVWLEK